MGGIISGPRYARKCLLKEVAQRNFKAIADQLTGIDPKRTQYGWAYGSHGSLQITTSGDFIYKWKCWETDTGGDVIALVMHLQGCRFPDALDWIESNYGGSA